MSWLFTEKTQPEAFKKKFDLGGWRVSKASGSFEGLELRASKNLIWSCAGLTFRWCQALNWYGLCAQIRETKRTHFLVVKEKPGHTKAGWLNKWKRIWWKIKLIGRWRCQIWLACLIYPRLIDKEPARTLDRFLLHTIEQGCAWWQTARAGYRAYWCQFCKHTIAIWIHRSRRTAHFGCNFFVR